MEHSPYSDAGNTAVYNRLALPAQFAEPARDLVSLLRTARGGRVLDVGSGTGAVAIPASEAVGDAGSVLATDASVEMLRHVKEKGLSCVAVARVPELPVEDGWFDIVTASFVISHFVNYPAGLKEMLRALRPGGRLGVSAWAPGQNAYGEAWVEVAARFANLDQLNRAFHDVIPWDELFSNEGDLRRALEDAGLVDVELIKRKYTIRIGVEEYLSMRSSSVEGTMLRRSLSAADWERFNAEMGQTFRERFDATVEYDREVHFAIGTKPA
jgi:ubiquinone/menaquinone biosynthesis C-methylase UbiE